MSSAAEHSDTPLESVSRPRLFGRAILVLLLIIWCAVIISAAAQNLLYPIRDDASLGTGLLLAAAFLAGPVLALVRRIRRFKQPHAACLPASLALALSSFGFLAWLAHDDATLRHAEIPASLRNDFPGAAETALLTLRYSVNQPGSLLSTAPSTRLAFPQFERNEKNDAAWAGFLDKNKSDLDSLWTEMAPLRAWIDELAACPEIGDQAFALNSPLPNFQTLRLVTQTIGARALQLADQGHRDEAVAITLPLLNAARKLQPHSTTLIRRMIAVVMQRNAQHMLARVVASGPISHDTIVALTAALAPASDTEDQARMLVWCEFHALGRNIIDRDSLKAAIAASTGRPVEFLVGMVLPFAINSRLTANVYGDHISHLADAAARNDPASMKTLSREFLARHGSRLPGKNLGGRVIMVIALPAFGKVVESYWKAEAERAALLTVVQDQA